MKNSQLFACYNRKVALYNKMKSKVCEKHEITPTSFDILMFLHNNSEVRTAEEICRLRGIKPAIVSVDIDKLDKKGYITRVVDVNDRRRLLISLTNSVEPITTDGTNMQQGFANMLFEGVEHDEAVIYINVLEKMLININKCERNQTTTFEN